LVVDPGGAAGERRRLLAPGCPLGRGGLASRLDRSCHVSLPRRRRGRRSRTRRLAGTSRQGGGATRQNGSSSADHSCGAGAPPRPPEGPPPLPPIASRRSLRLISAVA